MAYLPDILDRIGKTPREFGALQLHPEAAMWQPGRLTFTLWLQAAFDGPCDAVLELAHSAAPQPMRLGVPPLPGGAVIRWAFAADILDMPERAQLTLEAPLAKNAERIRTPWKLLDTVEQPKLPERSPGIDFTPSLGTVARIGVGLATGVLVVPLPRLGLGDGSNPQIKVHEAKVQTSMETAVEVGVPGSLGVETIWRPGMELPDERIYAPTFTPPPQPQKGQRELALCRSCAEQVDLREAEADRMCPRCGASWL